MSLNEETKVNLESIIDQTSNLYMRFTPMLNVKLTGLTTQNTNI